MSSHIKIPAHHLARQRLYRAIVTLPEHLSPKGEPHHDRIVFFDGPRSNPGEYLQTLLSHAWHDCPDSWEGLIYNVQAASSLADEGQSEDVDARLFELAWGGAGGITYASPERVDIFAAPVLKARLQTALNSLKTQVTT